MSDLLDVVKFNTFPRALRHNAQHYPDAVALREKDYGVWNVYTWSDYEREVKSYALGLHALGVNQGDIVGLIGDNGPSWLFAEVAVHAVRGATIGIYRDVLDEELGYLLNYSEARIVVAEDEEQVDKVLSLGDQASSVEKIIYWDSRGMRKQDDPRLMSIEQVVELGREIEQRDPDTYQKLLEAGSGADVCVLCTTSGTTAHPKLAMLTPERMLAHVSNYLLVDPKDGSDEYVSVLPLPWVMEQIYAVGMSLIARMKVNFVESAETMLEDMREIGPTFILFAPRVWESIAADVRSRIMDASPLKQKLFDYGMRLGLEALQQGGRSKLADIVLFHALRDRLGFTRLRSAATGGAALGPDTFKFFLAMGVPLRQLYGQTELMGAYTVHTKDDVDFDTVGKVFNECEIRIDNPDEEGVGEIVTRHPNIFLGYLKSEEAAKDLKSGRVDAHRRRGLLQPARPSGGDRPCQRPGPDHGRGALFSAVHRKQAQILPLRRRGGDSRRRPGLSHRDDLHPFFHRVEMGGEKQDLVYHLHGSGGAGRDLRSAAQRDHSGQRLPAERGSD